MGCNLRDSDRKFTRSHLGILFHIIGGRAGLGLEPTTSSYELEDVSPLNYRAIPIGCGGWTLTNVATSRRLTESNRPLLLNGAATAKTLAHPNYRVKGLKMPLDLEERILINYHKGDAAANEWRASPPEFGSDLHKELKKTLDEQSNEQDALIEECPGICIYSKRNAYREFLVKHGYYLDTKPYAI